MADTNTKAKMGVIGDKKSILVFKSLGVDVFGVEKEEDFVKAKEKLNSESYSILFITEDVAQNFHKEVEELYNKTLPAVLIIPSAKTSNGLGKSSLKKTLERALGSELNI